MDEQTSLLVLIPAGIGVLIEVSIWFIMRQIRGKRERHACKARAPSVCLRLLKNTRESTRVPQASWNLSHFYCKSCLINSCLELIAFWIPNFSFTELFHQTEFKFLYVLIKWLITQLLAVSWQKNMHNIMWHNDILMFTSCDLIPLGKTNNSKKFSLFPTSGFIAVLVAVPPRPILGMFGSIPVEIQIFSSYFVFDHLMYLLSTFKGKLKTAAGYRA